MKYKVLLQQSQALLNSQAPNTAVSINAVFSNGGRWMQQQMQLLYGNTIEPVPAARFQYYGYLKYVICLLAMLLSAVVLYHIHIYLLPLALLVFYWFEVHLLFLFPLIINGAKHPIAKSIRLTYQVGVIYAMANVIPIACYMVFGLLQRRAPFYRWHAGCLAILIWYKNETGTGL